PEAQYFVIRHHCIIILCFIPVGNVEYRHLQPDTNRSQTGWRGLSALYLYRAERTISSRALHNGRSETSFPDSAPAAGEGQPAGTHPASAYSSASGCG